MTPVFVNFVPFLGSVHGWPCTKPFLTVYIFSSVYGSFGETSQNRGSKSWHLRIGLPLCECSLSRKPYMGITILSLNSKTVHPNFLCQSKGEVFTEILHIFWSVTQEPLGLLTFQCHLWVQVQTICFKMLLLFKKNIDNFEILHKTCSILVQGAIPP